MEYRVLGVSELVVKQTTVQVADGSLPPITVSTVNKDDAALEEEIQDELAKQGGGAL